MKNLSVEQATELFETHPETEQFYVTTDGQAFFTEEHADSHGQRLKDRSVEAISRADLKTETEPTPVEEPAPAEEPAAKTNQKSKAGKDENNA